jgi:hypothetical protein
MSNWLRKISSGWVTLIALIVFVLFTALVLPRQSARSAVETGAEGSPDTSFFYSADDLYQFAESYGPEGRAAYIRSRLSFDVIWPIVYTAFLATAISWLFSRTFPLDSWWQRLNLVPVMGMLLDYLENLSTVIVMARYPDTTAIIDTLAPVFTLLKWTFVNGSFVVLLVGGLIAGWRRLRRK